MAKAALLIIEDEAEIQELLSLAMVKEGWKLIMAQTAEEGLDLLKQRAVDCIILDIMLPGMDGFTLLKKIKTDQDLQVRGIPVIMTTARGEEADIVAGLELGADDYVVKPYSPKVLIARVRAALRRKEEGAPKCAEKTFFRQGRISLNTQTHAVFLDEKPLDLSATEFSLLKHFLSQPDRVFSRNQIIDALHGSDYPVTDRSVDVQVLALRKKLMDGGDCIETIRGVGYRLKSL
ncbi:MAG: response regulator transcription factor [Spirochaetaceae bacterium]|nr:response regulator transcription factor [Spirochaetaceae bacterium]